LYEVRIRVMSATVRGGAVDAGASAASDEEVPISSASAATLNVHDSLSAMIVIPPLACWCHEYGVSIRRGTPIIHTRRRAFGFAVLPAPTLARLKKLRRRN
jgi:hypothetical protein